MLPQGGTEVGHFQILQILALELLKLPKIMNSDMLYSTKPNDISDFSVLVQQVKDTREKLESESVQKSLR